VHPHQTAFIDAIKAWNANEVAHSLVLIMQEVSQVECTPETTEDVTRACNSFLETMKYHPRVGITIDGSGSPITLVLTCLVDLFKHEANKGTSVLLTLALGALEPSSAHDRWRELGFTDKAVALDNDEIQIQAHPRKEQHSLGCQFKHSIVATKQPSGIDADLTYNHSFANRADVKRDLLERYLTAECAQVWKELVALGAEVRLGNFLPEAIAVTRDTMHRCRRNLEKLVSRLYSSGYEFRFPEEAILKPEGTVKEMVAAMETRVGLLPLSLCGWFELVGSVNLMGTHPDWRHGLGSPHPDPLVVYSSTDVLKYDEDNWEGGRYRLEIAPDAYHKEDVSGGPPYTIQVPNASADALLEGEWHRTTFVDYLRVAFRWGGFPGWQRLAPDERRSALINFLTEGFEPI
jgi:hypothetical protein